MFRFPITTSHERENPPCLPPCSPSPTRTSPPPSSTPTPPPLPPPRPPTVRQNAPPNHRHLKRPPLPPRQVIRRQPRPSALAALARGEDAVHLFDEMVGREKLPPDSLTFTCVLHACAHSGMAERGLKLFDEMQSVYGIKPRMEHYGAIVDLLGRAGRIEAAERVVSSMPFEPNRAVWGALLHACARNAHPALADKLAKRISELGLGLGFDVGVSNLYARVGRWEEVGEVRDRMVERGVQKEKGFSSVEVNGELVKFLAGDVTHPLTLQIHDLLERISAVIMVFDGRGLEGGLL